VKAQCRADVLHEQGCEGRGGWVGGVTQEEGMCDMTCLLRSHQSDGQPAAACLETVTDAQ
jgi:hypothetical protein